jgi:hypothetical protein
VIIKTYNASQLKELVESETFSTLKDIPVSRLRVASYLRNPRMRQEDILLVAAYEQGELIAYRTLLPDTLHAGEQLIRFAWLSGSWVRPDRRREGISTLLFDRAYEAWNGMLMYSNYAPDSKRLYDKTGRFRCVCTLEGMRAYLKLNLSGILGKRYAFFQSISFLLKGIDACANFIIQPRWRKQIMRLPAAQCICEPVPVINASLYSFIAAGSGAEASKRSEKEFNWILSYPWVIKGEVQPENRRYHFTSAAKKFDLLTLQFKVEDRISAFAFFSNRDGSAHLRYCYASPDALKEVASRLMQYLVEQESDRLTIYEPRIVSILQEKYRYLFVFHRKYRKLYFASDKLMDSIPAGAEIMFQDGDGDSVFS